MSLPNGWKIAKLESLVNFSSGGTPSKNNPEFWKGSIPWISASTMHTQNIYVSDLMISEEGLNSGSRLAQEGDLLLLVRGSMLWNKVPICICKRSVAFNQDVKGISVGSKILSEYLLYWFLTHQQFLLNKVVGTGIGAGKLDSNDLLNLEILLPTLPEQKAIADLLSIWDAAIEKTEQLIKAKEKQFQWLLNELITKPSQSGKWKEVKFGDLYDKEIIIEKGRPLTREEIGDSGTIPVVAGGQSYSCYNNSATHTVETITISSSGAYAGFVWYHSYPIWASDCSVITSNTINMRFLYHVLKSKQLPIYALQAGGAQPHIYSKDLANIRVAIPRRNDQDQTVFVLDSANKEIDVMKNVADKYKQQKRGLMQKLLTGMWQVTPEIIKNYEDATL